MSKRAATLTEQGGLPASGISCNVLTESHIPVFIINYFNTIRAEKSYRSSLWPKLLLMPISRLSAVG